MEARLEFRNSIIVIVVCLGLRIRNRNRPLTKQQARFPRGQVDNHLPERTISPGVPRPQKLGRVVDVDALVDETEAGARCLQGSQTPADFRVVVARQDLHDRAHGPHGFEVDVGAALALERGADDVVRVPVAGEHHGSRGPVQGVRGVDEPQVRQGQERRRARVVHENSRPVSVDLVGQHFAVQRVGEDGVLVDALRDRLAERGALHGHFGRNRRENVGGAGEFDGHEGVGGDVEGENGRVVTGAEGGADQAC